MNPQIGCCSLVWLPVPLPRHWYVTMSTGWWHLQELVRFHRHKWRKPHYIICQLAIGLHSPRKRCHCRSNKYYILGRESHFYLTPNKIISNKRISLHICSICKVTIKLQNKQYGYSDKKEENKWSSAERVNQIRLYQVMLDLVMSYQVMSD